MMAAGSAWTRSSASESGAYIGRRPVRRVLIVDDHPIVRQGLRRIMENEDDLVVCGEAESVPFAQDRDRRLGRPKQDNLVVARLAAERRDAPPPPLR